MKSREKDVVVSAITIFVGMEIVMRSGSYMAYSGACIALAGLGYLWWRRSS